jgi:hypothetical protein
MWMMGWVFRHDEYAKRCSAHAFGDPVEGKTFYDDLMATGHDLGVSMPVMESFAEDIKVLQNRLPQYNSSESELKKKISV